jgi:hypothetical protein
MLRGPRLAKKGYFLRTETTCSISQSQRLSFTTALYLAALLHELSSVRRSNRVCDTFANSGFDLRRRHSSRPVRMGQKGSNRCSYQLT